MGGFLTPLDLCIFVGSLVVVMGLGLWAGWKEESSDDYFLAGHTSRWWGVAGSIFGSNVSANHIIGMMGVGFAAGFAMSHFEITAIAGLLLLCYGFLPVYRKLRVYTLSDYLGRRFGESSRVLYAIIMLLVIVVIQMVPGFYIGSRALNTLIGGGETATAKAIVAPDGSLREITFTEGREYATVPGVQIDLPPSRNADNLATASADIGEIEIKDADGNVIETVTGVTSIKIDNPGGGYDPDFPPNVKLKGGAAFSPSLQPGDINPQWYKFGIILMAVVTGAYTIIGGLKAVIVTDVLQSILMLIAAVIVGVVIFSQPEIGGWTGMMALDSRPAAEGGKGLMHLYKPTTDAEFPWTGTLSGLLVLHFYYWGTNQFIVQRALAARSDREARIGIIAAGFFKLLIPFLSIGGGIAAYYYFTKNNIEVDKDAAFMELMRYVVAPLGYGIVGLVAAGVVGAILSSVDSMLNSGATIMTFDVYKRYINPEASEKGLVWMGRMWVVIFIVAAATLTIFTMDPNSKDSFFIHIATHQSKLIAGVVVAFALGMFWSRTTSAAATTAIVAGVAASYCFPLLYSGDLQGTKLMRGYTGTVKVAQFDEEVVRMYQQNEEKTATPGQFDQHHLRDGDTVRFAGSKELPAAVPAISTDKSYYVRTHDAYELSLYHSRRDAEKDVNPITFATGGQGNQTLYLGSRRLTVSWWGTQLNFMHSVFLAATLALILGVVVSLLTPPPAEEQANLTWTKVGGHSPSEVTKTAWKLAASIALFALLGWMMVLGNISPAIAGLIAAAWTWLMFLDVALISVVLSHHPANTTAERSADERDLRHPVQPISLLEEDRFWGGLLAAVAVFMMFFFY